METKAERNEQFFEDYRQLKKQYAELDREVDAAKDMVRVLVTQQHTMHNKLECMRKIITTMIEDDIDPMQAKLRDDNDMFRDTMWAKQSPYYGATGAIGHPGVVATSLSSISGIANSDPNSWMVSSIYNSGYSTKI
jgi:cobalamin biosynthesis Mg chelatase CobN